MSIEEDLKNKGELLIGVVVKEISRQRPGTTMKIGDVVKVTFTPWNVLPLYLCPRGEPMPLFDGAGAKKDEIVILTQKGEQE